MRSTTPPPPFAGADTDQCGPEGTGPDGSGAPDPQAILSAAELLSGRRVFGMVWLDDALIVRTVYGGLVGFVPHNVAIGEAVLPFAGMEDEIRALKHRPDSLLDLPGVGIVRDGQQLPRLNLLVLWSGTEQRYLLVASRPSSASGIEAELAKQMRARLIAEAEVRAKSKELARANADLENFASIIAHDLSAPLRAMRDLTRRLGVELHGGQAAGADTALEAVRGLDEHAVRLGSMLRELHEYSSIGRKQDAVESVDTGQLIGRIVRSIPRPMPFSVTVSGNWPRIDTLSAPLDIVLRNLVDNAIKHHDRANGAVEISAEADGEMLSITIADDGPGIPPEHRAAAFLPFRTLSQPGVAPAVPAGGGGTGMGLAFVRRTVETIGGRLELTSVPEIPRGARFRVVWPLRLPL